MGVEPPTLPAIPTLDGTKQNVVNDVCRREVRSLQVAVDGVVVVSTLDVFGFDQRLDARLQSTMHQG